MRVFVSSKELAILNNPEERAKWIAEKKAHPETLGTLWRDLDYTAEEAAELSVEALRLLVVNYSASSLVKDLLTSGHTTQDMVVLAMCIGLVLGELGLDPTSV